VWVEAGVLRDGKVPRYTGSMLSSSGNPRRRVINTGNAVLTADDVRRILERYYGGDVDTQPTQRELAREYRVSMQTVARLVRGETWGHLSAQYLSRDESSSQ